MSIKFFVSIMHHSSTDARNENIFYGGGRVLIDFFKSYVIVDRNENIFFSVKRAPITVPLRV